MKIIVYISVFIYSAVSQNEKKFICTDGQAIEVNKLCDGPKHCSDGSDEARLLCYQMLCPLNTFRCHYGACIASNLRCDGTKHCADGSDEIQCGEQLNSCSMTEFRCSTGECISVEKLCDGISDCKENTDEGIICKKITSCPPFTYRCKVGSCIYLNQTCDGHKDCIDGSDERETLCKTINCTNADCDTKVNMQVKCPPVLSDRINVHCEVPSGPIKGIYPCNQPLPPGAVVRYECKEYYIPASVKHKHNKEMICQMDGSWNREVLKCIPDCGITQLDIAPLIVNAWKAEKGGFPWHAVLFTLEEGKWLFTCGGTLITEKIVLTAAHCVWNTRKDMLQIGLGKYFSDYYQEEDYSQLKNISQIIIQPSYQDFIGNYGSDLAILVLNSLVEFSAFIRPACVDWNLSDLTEHLKSDNLGLIVGMGLTENDTFSSHLKAVFLPVVNNSVCIKNQKKDFKKYLAFTSFCAGWGNGTGVCNGDSGGGLMFSSAQNPKKYFLQGIVSVSPRRPGTSFCDPNYFTIFTKVGMYVEWIHDTLKNIHDSIKYDADVVF